MFFTIYPSHPPSFFPHFPPFSGLLPRLLALPEELVAHRLAVPLLSRFVLLDEAAVTHVVPHLLTPRSGESWLTVEDRSLLPGSVWWKYRPKEYVLYFQTPPVVDVKFFLFFSSFFLFFVFALGSSVQCLWTLSTILLLIIIIIIAGS